jgi:diguanylate cyclase (GGDEF)-like protein
VSSTSSSDGSRRAEPLRGRSRADRDRSDRWPGERRAAVGGVRLPDQRDAPFAGLSTAAGWDLDLATGDLSWADPTYRLVGAVPGSTAPTVAWWMSLVHEHDRPRVRASYLLARETCRGYQEQYRLVGLDGVERQVHAWTEVATDPSGAAVRMFGALVDITGLGQLEHRDPLTGLLGRSALEVRAATAITAARPDRCAALLIVDVDRFGRVNDTWGRRCGDMALAVVATRLREAVPVGSTVVRLGGDQFAVLLADLPTVGLARDVAHDVLAAIAEPLTLPGALEGLAMTATVGVALADGVSGAVDVDALCHRAELALHRAQASGNDGRGSYLVFRPELHEQAQARVRTEAMLRSALAAERLQVLYQPVVDLASGEVRGVEALCRVVDPQLGPLSPALFMDVAEETGLVVEMDEWVLHHATAFASRWQLGRGPGLGGAGGAAGDGEPERVSTALPTVAVNMSPRSLARPDLAAVVSAALCGAGAAGRRLLVEITEHSLLERDDHVRATLGALEDLGVAVGVDDFGTGWSALSYLAGLDLGFLKVDRSFVARLGQDAAAEAVVRAIVELAHAHHLVCIAEGVETQAQAEVLAAMGCDHGQGWWFGRPTAEQQLDEVVSAWYDRARATGFGAYWRPGREAASREAGRGALGRAGAGRGRAPVGRAAREHSA